MLRRALPLRQLRPGPLPHRAPARRAFSTAPLFDPLVALLGALPSLPLVAASPYPQTTSLVLLAVALRTLALPATLWSRARQRRMAELVLPAWEQAKRTMPEDVGRRCRQQGRSYEEYKTELQRELKAHLKSLLAQHRCTPIPTLVLPAAVQLPLFIIASQTIRLSIGLPDSSFGSEVQPWWSAPPGLEAQFAEGAKVLAARGLEGEALEALTRPMGPDLREIDRSMMGPIALGMSTLSTVEMTQWARLTERERDSSQEAAEAEDSKEAAGDKAAQQTLQSVAEPLRSRVLANTLRAGSIVFVVVSSQAPAAVLVYWLSSSLYTLVQNSIFTVVDRRRALRVAPAGAAAAALSAADLVRRQRRSRHIERAVAQTRVGNAGEMGKGETRRKLAIVGRTPNSAAKRGQ